MNNNQILHGIKQKEVKKLTQNFSPVLVKEMEKSLQIYVMEMEFWRVKRYDFQWISNNVT